MTAQGLRTQGLTTQLKGFTQRRKSLFIFKFREYYFASIAWQAVMAIIL